MGRGRIRNPRRRRLRKGIRWGLGAFGILLVLEYLVLPQLGGARKSLNLVGQVNVAFLLVGLVLEAAALVAYAQLTYTVLPRGGPSRSRLFRINMSSLALSHVMPGGTAPGAALAYRLLTQENVSGPDAGFALAMQGVGSALVLNLIFWMALFVSLFFHGYNPLYAVAAGAGVLMMAIFATVVVLLTRGRSRSVETVRHLAERVPFLDSERLAAAVQRIADRLKALAEDRELLVRAIGWATANWLLDAASLWVFIAAFHKVVSPIDLLVAYGLANVLAVIPITPGGFGVVEGALIPTLHGFHVPSKIAVLGVLSYRLVNFWLPIPTGGAAYLSLRFTSQSWRERLSHAHREIVEGVVERELPVVQQSDNGSASSVADTTSSTDTGSQVVSDPDPPVISDPGGGSSVPSASPAENGRGSAEADPAATRAVTSSQKRLGSNRTSRFGRIRKHPGHEAV